MLLEEKRAKDEAGAAVEQPLQGGDAAVAADAAATPSPTPSIHSPAPGEGGEGGVTVDGSAGEGGEGGVAQAASASLSEAISSRRLSCL